MQLYRTLHSLPDHAKGAAVALGNFDGLHLGHQEILRRAKNWASANNTPFAVMSFEPHPREVLAPQLPPYRLSPMRGKLELLREFGVEIIYLQNFTKQFSQLSAKEFIAKILLHHMQIKYLVVGENFRFGHNKGGDVLLLEDLIDKNVHFECAPPVTCKDGMTVSSSRIRTALQTGDMQLATSLLGRPWGITGRVMHVHGRGRKIGFPTANILLKSHLHPEYGVYAVRAQLPDGRMIDGVANIGNRPTFCGQHVFLEAHLIDFDEDLYGKHLRVDLIDFIRPEQKFPNIDALISQLHHDKQTAQGILKA